MDPFSAFQVVAAVGGGLSKRAEAMGEAARAESEARLADTQALQRDTQSRDELRRFLGSVAAARAGSGLSTTSPNARILTGEARKVSDDDRLRSRADDRQRAANFRTAARNYRSAGRVSLISGVASAGIPLAEAYMSRK